jgi:hypothetical protein
MQMHACTRTSISLLTETCCVLQKALAAAASIETSQVSIEKVEPLSSASRAGRRRLLADSIKVYSAMTTSDVGSATTVSGALTVERINYQLQTQALPQAELVDAPKVLAKKLWRLDWTAGFSKQESDQKLTVKYEDEIEFTWPDDSNHNVYLLQDKDAFG